jgi:hypothetical protein
MFQIITSFHHVALTQEPLCLKNRFIWAVANQVRNQLLDNMLDRQIHLSQIEEKAALLLSPIKSEPIGDGVHQGMEWDLPIVCPARQTGDPLLNDRCVLVPQ